MHRSINKITPGLLVFICIAALITAPVAAFKANSLDVTVSKNGDATATFRFTLEGVLENAIPQSILEDELKKGLTTSSDPPALVSMDRSSATLVLKKFADTSDVPTGTEYRTESMNFKKAEIALQSSALSSVVSADFSPTIMTVTFPDGFSRKFENLDNLPSVTHTVVDPAKAAAAGPRNESILKVVSTPPGVHISIDGTYIGDAPSQFTDIAPGTHTLTFEKDGFKPVTKTVTVRQGENLQVSAVLVYASPTTPSAQSPGFGAVISILAGAFACIAGGYLRR